MQVSWRSVSAVDGVAAALVVGGTLAIFLLVSLVIQLTKKKRKKAQAPFHLDDEALDHEELVAQQVPNQKDGSVGSSLDFLPKSVTCEDEDMDGALGSPDKLLWTALSASESDTDEISETMRARVVRDDWYVYRREWVTFGKNIAEGAQAEIYAATVANPSLSDEPQQEVAVKKFKTFNGISHGHNPPGLKSFKCLTVCCPTGVFFDDGQLCLVTPRLTGDLRAVIDREMRLHSAPPFPEPVAVHIIMQLAMGLKGLHDVGIYHRDLKADNILVKKMKVMNSYKVYISDFESSEDVLGTLFYRAPEVLRCVQARMEGRGHRRACLPEHEWAAADVYSFGMMCYEILTGEVPMIGDKWSDYSMALSGHGPELPPGVVSEDLRIMIERCWHEDPRCRPTPSKIMEYLKMIDNSGKARGWLSEIERMANAVEVTTGNLKEHVLEMLDHLLRLTRELFEPNPELKIAEPNPELTKAGVEFLTHVQEFIPKFHALSHHPQQSFPLQKYMELRKLLSLIDWTKHRFLKKALELVDSGDDSWLQWLRTTELVKKIHAATNKTSLQRSRLAPADGLPIDEKKELLRDFVEPQLAAGVWMQYVCMESEITIRHISDTKHRWALRCHLFFLCVIHRLRIDFMHRLEIEVGCFIPFLVEFLLRSRVLGRILVRVLGNDYSLFWYFDLTPTVGFRRGQSTSALVLPNAVQLCCREWRGLQIYLPH